MIYDLSALVEWTRRSGSDKLVRARDVLVTDGTTDVTLSNSGNIAITKLTLAGELQLPGSDYTIEVNTVVFDPAPAQGSQVVALYDYSTYTDAEVVDYLVDAIRAVISELALFGWQLNLVDAEHPLVNDPTDVDIPAANVMNQALETLIALKAGIQIRKDIANSAGGDAILIKDGDTTIDTSKTARASETVLSRMLGEYTQLLNITIANRTRGVMIQNNWVPLPYPWSTPNMMPGEVNGPTY